MSGARPGRPGRWRDAPEDGSAGTKEAAGGEPAARACVDSPSQSDDDGGMRRTRNAPSRPSGCRPRSFRLLAGALALAGALLELVTPCPAAGAARGAAGESAAAGDLFVSLDGDDAWSGRLVAPVPDRTDGPFRTLRRAQTAVRELRAREPDRQRPVVILLRGGVHELEEALVFRPEDSGTEASPTVYAAYPGETPVVSGGRRITGWRAGEDGRWRARIEGASDGRWLFSQLFVGGQRRYRSRLPASGWLTVAGELPPSEAARGKGNDRFQFAGDDIRPQWAGDTGVEVVAVHIWSASRMRIRSVDAAAKIVTFTGTTRGTASWASFQKGGRYLIENVPDALGAPGSWRLDTREGEVTYVPVAGEEPTSTEVVAPRLERLVVFEGDVQGRRWVEHLRLRGILFAHTRWVLPPEGSSYPQAEVQLSAAIEGIGARDIALEECGVAHTGGYAVAWGAGCRDDRLERCELFDLGGGGVKIGQAGGPGSWSAGQPRSDDPESLVSGNIVRDTWIAHGGRLHMAAVGVWIGHASNNIIDHNEIHDLYYTGVSVGWVWGYSPSLAHDNEISHNHLHHLGQGVLSDLAGVYTLGISPGTTVHHNHVHDIVAYDYGGWGLYTDEGSTGIVLEKNLVHDTKTGGFHQHYGKENVIANNIFAFAKEQQLQRTRGEPHLSFTFERNIVLWTGVSPLLGSNWKDGSFAMDANDYWNTDHPVTFPGGLDLAAWQKSRGVDARSIVADPRLKDPAHGDYRLEEGSPALGLGFEPWDLGDVGPRGRLRFQPGHPEPGRAFP